MDIEAILIDAAVVIMEDTEAIRIDNVDYTNKLFTGTGEETGEEYTVKFDEMNLETTMFYKLTLMET